MEWTPDNHLRHSRFIRLFNLLRREASTHRPPRASGRFAYGHSGVSIGRIAVT
jgi:hypothetical protein